MASQDAFNQMRHLVTLFQYLEIVTRSHLEYQLDWEKILLHMHKLQCRALNELNCGIFSPKIHLYETLYIQNSLSLFFYSIHMKSLANGIHNCNPFTTEGLYNMFPISKKKKKIKLF